MTTTTSVDRPACVLAWFRQSTEGCQKIPEDLTRYRSLMERARPAVVVETGTGSGHSALWFADQGCRVVTVDLEPWAGDLTIAAWQGRVTQIAGSSSSPETIEAVRRAIGDEGPVLVSLDSDHSSDHVRQEMELFGDFVAIGSYMVVEDTVLAWMPLHSPQRAMFDGTPLEAVEDFLTAHEEWEIDHSIEGTSPATQHPGGWLRRIA